MTSLTEGTYRLRLAIASATRSDLKVQKTSRKMLEKRLALGFSHKLFHFMPADQCQLNGVGVVTGFPADESGNG